MNVKSPATREDVSKKIEKFKYTQTPYLDGYILSLSLTLAYALGLKNQEIIDLNIGDVMKGNGIIRSSISLKCKSTSKSKVKDKVISLPSDLKKAIRDHIKYLREHGYFIEMDAPLVPMKNKKRYYKRQMTNHFKNIRGSLYLGELRKAGICNYYEDLINNGFDSEKALKQTSIFARCENRETIGIITDTIENKLRTRPRLRMISESGSDIF